MFECFSFFIIDCITNLDKCVKMEIMYKNQLAAIEKKRVGLINC